MPQASTSRPAAGLSNSSVSVYPDSFQLFSSSIDSRCPALKQGQYNISIAQLNPFTSFCASTHRRFSIRNFAESTPRSVQSPSEWTSSISESIVLSIRIFCAFLYMLTSYTAWKEDSSSLSPRASSLTHSAPASMRPESFQPAPLKKIVPPRELSQPKLTKMPYRGPSPTSNS